MTSFKVRKGEGYILGDLLHKFAVRGSPSWQVAAYDTGKRPENMGLADGSKGSVLDFIGNVLTCDEEPSATTQEGEYKRLDFEWRQGQYVSGHFHITGLAKQRDVLTALLVYSYGQRTSKQNFALVETAIGAADSGHWYAVPTRHVTAGAFRYRVEPYGTDEEWLCINAEDKIVREALQAATASIAQLGTII